MLSMIVNWLKKPFPFIESLRDKLFISFISGCVVLLFLVMFQPFGIDTVHENIYLYLSGYGVITMGAVGLSLILLPMSLPGIFNYDKWNIGKNILLIIWVLVIITLFNYAYGEYIVNRNYVDALIHNDRTGLLSWIFMTFSVGIFPVLFIVYFAERQFLKRNQRIADEINKGIHKPAIDYEGMRVTLESGINKSFEISTSELICIQAEGGNYSTVYWQTGSDLSKELLRLTLLNFLKKVGPDKNIVRCHKSYIVNLDKVENVRGNARSLTLEIKGLDFEIPVSRSFPREQLVNIA